MNLLRLSFTRRRAAPQVDSRLGGRVRQRVRLQVGGHHGAIRLLGPHGLLDKLPRDSSVMTLFGISAVIPKYAYRVLGPDFGQVP